MREPNTRTRELLLMEFVSHWTRRAELHWVAPAHWAFIIASRKRSSDPAATAFRILASKRNIYKRGPVSDSFRSVRGQVGPGEKCLCFILLCSGAVLLIEDLRSLERLYLPQPCGCLCNTKQRGGVFQSQSSLMFWFRWSITNLKNYKYRTAERRVQVEQPAASAPHNDKVKGPVSCIQQTENGIQ